MILKRVILGAVVALLLTGAATAAPSVPAEVREAVNVLYNASMQATVDEEAPGPAPVFVAPARMFRKVEVNGDGAPDWRVDFERAENASFFCGTGGCQQQVWVSRRGGGYILAFDTNVREFALRRVKGERVLDVDFHGTTCGGYGAQECDRRYVWDPRLQRFIERINRKGGTWLEAGPASVIVTPAGAAPPEAFVQINRFKAICTAVGGELRDEAGSYNDLPDLNGDGVRDWVIGTAYSSCAMGETGRDTPSLPLTILVSRQDGTFSVAFDELQPRWGIELGAAAHVITFEGPDCSFDGTGCIRVVWRWDGERLVRTP